MVHSKFTTSPRTPVGSPKFAAMALDDKHRESSTEQPEASLTDEKDVVSKEATSEQGAGSDGENPSDGSGDSEHTFDSGGCLKIGAEATLASMSYEFG
jgi:hypothetical protein